MIEIYTNHNNNHINLCFHLCFKSINFIIKAMVLYCIYITLICSLHEYILNQTGYYHLSYVKIISFYIYVSIIYIYEVLITVYIQSTFHSII